VPNYIMPSNLQNRVDAPDATEENMDGEIV
jgi:hypothetical protein